MGIRKFVWRQVELIVGGMMSMARGMMPGALAGDMGMAAGGGIRVDVSEDMDEVFVAADLPGVEKESIAVRLLSPTGLEIASVRCSEKAETAEGEQFKRRERNCGLADRVVPLSSAATADGSRASLENGVLRVRLVKVERGERISIE
jgi:HSP20 family protein